MWKVVDTDISMVSYEATFDDMQAQIALKLSQDAYCGKDQYLNHTFTGAVEGFIADSIIYDASSDTEGFIGFLPFDQSIYVVFRGSETIKNWIADFNIERTTHDDSDCSNCWVHKGYYTAHKNIIQDVLLEVEKLSYSYGTSLVKTTGHSKGAALANLSALDLKRAGYDVSMINFGQPRIGNAQYAAYFGKMLPNTFRVVHYRDIIPHSPQTAMGYLHSATEVFED